MALSFSHHIEETLHRPSPNSQYPTHSPRLAENAALTNHGVGPCREGYLDHGQHNNLLIAFRGYCNIQEHQGCLKYGHWLFLLWIAATCQSCSLRAIILWLPMKSKVQHNMWAVSNVRSIGASGSGSDLSDITLWLLAQVVEHPSEQL